MEVIIIFQRMLMLLAMMGLGYLSYKMNWLEDNSYKKLSEVVVNIFNPTLVLNGALTATQAGGADLGLVKENLIFVIIYFAVNIVISYPISMLLGKDEGQKNMFKLMTIFSNVGFMGIPVVSSIYGQESIIYVTFYMLSYNLILYTLGMYIAQKNLPKEERKNNISGLLNIGTICSILALIIYFSEVKFNDSVLAFFDYVGNATIPLSMMVIGVSVARIPLKEVFKGVRIYLFALLTLIVIPIVVCLLFRGMENNETIYGVYILMYAMPVGSIVTMLIKENGGDESLSSRTTIITTLLSIITIPIVSAFI